MSAHGYAARDAARVAHNGLLRLLLVLSLGLLCLRGYAAAAVPPGTIVRDIEIRGHRRTQEATIRFYLKTEVGKPFSPQVLREDIRRLYALGVFDNIMVTAEPIADGVRLVFIVSEKPTVRNVTFSGNRFVNDDEIRQRLRLRPRDTFDRHRLRETVSSLRSYYREQGYYFAHVSPEVTAVADNQVDVHLRITEGKKVRIASIRFTGNAHFTSAELRRQLQLKEFVLPVLSSTSSLYRPELLRVDLQLVENFYQNHGFVDVQLGEPLVEINREAGAVTITVPIASEGEQYKLGRLDVQGDEVFSAEALRQQLRLATGEIYSREAVRRTILALTEAYTDKGYAFADVTPTVTVDREARLIHLRFTTRPGPRVYIGRIDIVGNERTRDWVIRRELRFHEGELYSGSKLRRSRQRLLNLQYFEEVKIDTKRRADEALLDVEVEVREQSTGQFTAGLGFSSIEAVVFTAAVTQRNLFGRGQSITASARIGGLSQDFLLDFREPWLFGRPIIAGFSVFRRSLDFFTFDVRRTGFNLSLGRHFGEFTRLTTTYNFEILEISDLDPSASQFLQEQEGTSIVSSITPRLVYDSRDNVFDPSGGALHSFEVELAGLSGARFFKVLGDSTWYFPLPAGLTGFVRGRFGLGDGYGGDVMPASERFFLGGVTTIRGFDFREIGPQDAEGNPLGGTAFVQFNLEVGRSFGRLLRLVAFVDAGNVYPSLSRFDLGELRRSAGFGIRLLTPVGPIRLDWGFKLDRRPGESIGELGFLLGSF
ncbi:MAG: outer membrane protein assembly factor BamA [Candidatus Tectimicrobiota bacterium]|nr:MAG: outer membrane protein assembly factor BamA [Candidatus Tectomicrobia bacterium]